MRNDLQNLSGNIESIVRSYSQIKHFFSCGSTIRDYCDDPSLEYHLRCIEEQLLRIRSIGRNLKQKAADLTPPPDEEKSSRPESSAANSVAVHQQISGPGKERIDISKYRRNIFEQDKEKTFAPSFDPACDSVPAEPESNSDFKYLKNIYKNKCEEVEKLGKIMGMRLWISFSVLMVCIFLFIFLFSINSSSGRLHVHQWAVPAVMIFVPLAIFLNFFLGKIWKSYSCLKKEKAELEGQVMENWDQSQVPSPTAQEKKYIDSIIRSFDERFAAIKSFAFRRFMLWLLFNIGNFVIMASTVKYSGKDNKILLICIIWLLLTTGFFLLSPLTAWIKLRHEKLALEHSKTSPAAADPEVALMAPEELAARMEKAYKLKWVFLILAILLAVPSFIVSSALVMLINYGKELTHPGAIIFYIVAAVNYAMWIIAFRCFKKYNKEYKRLSGR